MPLKNNIKEQANKNIAKLPAASKTTSEPIQIPLTHTIVLNKQTAIKSRSFTRYSIDDNGGGYLGL